MHSRTKETINAGTVCFPDLAMDFKGFWYLRGHSKLTCQPLPHFGVLILNKSQPLAENADIQNASLVFLEEVTVPDSMILIVGFRF